MPPKGFRKEDYSPLHCAVCTGPIPENVRPDAVTCSKECSEKRAASIRYRKRSKICPICNRPATPEERDRFNRWRQWEKRGTTDESANVHLLREVQKLKAELQELQDRAAVDAL